jgi:hypothetical protein
MFQSPEVFQLLSPYFDEDHFQKQVRRLTALPSSLNQLGLTIIGAQKRNQNYDYEKQQQLLRQAIEDLAVLSQSDRQHLFAALAPSISNEIEAAWQIFDHLPYSSGYNRRPFRLVGPSNLIERNLARSTWVQRLIHTIQGYEQPVTWFAIWAAYLGWGAPDALGPLFAGAIDMGGPTGQEVFDILTASARGDHPTGKMGRHVVRGLLCASRPDGWNFIERLLLAAQREEGLRQVILEAADEAHPDAFHRLLRVVVEQNLIRFSAVVRAATVWVGLPFDAANPKTAQAVLTKLQSFLDDPDAYQAALAGVAPEDAYLALWRIAYEDAVQAIEAAGPLLHHPQSEVRFAAVYFLSQMQLQECGAALLPMMEDSDLRIATTAYAGVVTCLRIGKHIQENELFESVERLLQRIPERTKTLKPIVWNWMTLQIDRKSIADALIGYLGKRSPSRLLPYLNRMNSYARVSAAKLFQEHINEDPRYRKALFDLAADRDGSVHEPIFSLLEKINPCEDEIFQLEALLTRKTDSLRRGVIGLLMRQPDASLLATIDRMLSQRDEQQRHAGIEMLREMALSGRRREECQERVSGLQAQGLSEAEKHILADLLVEEIIPYTLKDALRLANLDHLSQPIEPKTKNTLLGLVKKIRLGSSAAFACIQALDELVEQHRTEPIQINDWQNEARTELLGNVRRGLILPDPNLSLEENRGRFQLPEVWERWWQERTKAHRDEDGLELLRAQAALSLMTSQLSKSGQWTQVVPKELRTYLDESYDLRLKFAGIVEYILDWLTYLHPAPGSVEFLLDGVEEICYRIGQNPIKESPFSGEDRWRHSPNQLGYLKLARLSRRMQKESWTASHHARFWGLVRWLEQYTWHKGGYYRPELDDILQGYQVGAATEDDLMMYLLGVPEEKGLEDRLRHLVANRFQVHSNRQQFGEIRQFSGRRPQPIFTEFPILRRAIERCRERILEIELRRGDLPTAASAPALALRSIPGMNHLIELLAALGKTEFDRSSYSFNQNLSTVLSHLIRVSYPLETDTFETFADLAQASRISERRLVELAVYAPQWANFVENTLHWPGLAEGVWWIYAHTKDRQWSIDAEIRENWAAQISEYTPLSADELLDGAVDVAWFYRMYDVLGEARWQEIYRAAIYAASGTGHARARLFADAMLGALSTIELIERVRVKRYQDAVRALGLIPLPKDETCQTEMLDRYEVMQEFQRTSKQFGSQRQASEKLAVTIGMENLARTAEYADPQRLEWAMELKSVTDLTKGPIVVQAEDVYLALSINDLGEAELSIKRGEKTLKSLPPAVKENEQVAALVERRQALERQARRMRASLETAMVRGDEFSAGEIQTLFGHPILKVMLEQLIFIGPAGMGYPTDEGQALEAFSGRIPLASEDRLRIAHPSDLLQSGCWHDWQHECFVTERIQPFKQVFRELYVLTGTEQDEKNFSRRYAGQQVNPRQALALFGSRGWVTAPEEGVFKTFHAEGIVARVGFLQGFSTPAEVEGLTIEVAGFTRRGEWLPIKLEQVPLRLFSEVMRDVDLVVSVAHAGGVDPEASASTVESRSGLVQETCALLHLANVRVENHHAIIDGKLGNYTIHLGSGTVHKQPGGAICIIPVHSQHRGRLFLPFADNDPKTAEVVSKVLLLAKDQEIRDPTIIEQIMK